MSVLNHRVWHAVEWQGDSYETILTRGHHIPLGIQHFMADFETTLAGDHYHLLGFQHFMVNFSFYPYAQFPSKY
jgi:hypothetical protein